MTWSAPIEATISTFLRAAYARYLGAERLGELHREPPDPSGRAVDQDLLPRPGGITDQGRLKPAGDGRSRATRFVPDGLAISTASVSVMTSRAGLSTIMLLMFTTRPPGAL